jgi:hypothetical protein
MIYIKLNNKEVTLGGTVATEEMLAIGWVEYNGEIPNIERDDKFSKIVFVDGVLVLEVDAEAKLTSDIAEAKAYLESTDFKMTVDYDEDVTEVKLKRKEAREFIRANEIKE